MWHAITGQPSPAFPDVRWTPAWELRVQHQRFDAPSAHPASPGCFLDRHVTAERHLPLPSISRDTKGCDEVLTGASVSLASKSGGVLAVEGDGKTRFQRDWDFLRFHAERAIERRHFVRQAVPNHEDYLRPADGMNDWHRAEALAAYAVQWKTRCATLGPSPHPVDVLLSSYHCAGSANICFALAMVLGIPARRISTSGHSTCELFIHGRWCWVDNIRAGAHLLPFSYQEFLAQMATLPCVNPGQRAHHSKAEVFYRAPYDYMPSLYWRVSGEVPKVEATGDVGSGMGLTVHYDPDTARALYPELAQHRFHADACAEPTLTIGAKGSWLHAPITVAPGVSLRRQFTISEAEDNPIEAGELCVWIGADTDVEILRLTMDGRELPCIGAREHRGCHRAAIFVIEPTLLTPGTHEWCLTHSCADGAELVVYPDVVEPYLPSASHAELRVPATVVVTDRVIDPAPRPVAVGTSTPPRAGVLGVAQAVGHQS